ncbi:MAG: hypothetical protein ACL93V_12525 [Candidatus Electrothrix sp. YB6]
MEPSKNRELTIKCLHKAVLEMMSFEWHQEVANLPETERKEASLRAMKCFNAKDKLVNAQLKDIRDKLEQNEDALTTERKKLEDALKDLKQVKDILEAASSLLSVVAKVVTL